LLAVLMGHVKNWARASVLKTPFPDSEAGRPFLDAYFPMQLRTSFPEAFVKHPLRREIIATAAINYLVNKAGIRFIFHARSSTGLDLGAVVQTYLELDCAYATHGTGGVQPSGLAPKEHYEALLQIEGALTQAVEGARQPQLGGRRS
jgi:glutamate dehydrogenase